MPDASLNPSILREDALEPLLVSVPETRRLLGGISARTLWTLTDKGEIPCVRIGKRVLYSPEVLRTWVARKSRGGTP